MFMFDTLWFVFISKFHLYNFLCRFSRNLLTARVSICTCHQASLDFHENIWIFAFFRLEMQFLCSQHVSNHIRMPHVAPQCPRRGSGAIIGEMVKMTRIQTPPRQGREPSSSTWNFSKLKASHSFLVRVLSNCKSRIHRWASPNSSISQ